MAPRSHQYQSAQSSFSADSHANQYANMPTNSTNYTPSQYTPSTAAPQSAPSAAQQVQQAPASDETLEQRLLDLFHPFRDECFTDDDSDPTFTMDQRKVVIMCENIAFLIRHNQSMYGKTVVASDVSVISRHWEIMKRGKGVAGISVLVNGNGYTHTVVRTNVLVGQKPLQCLSAAADKSLAGFFPDIPDIEEKW